MSNVELNKLLYSVRTNVYCVLDGASIEDLPQRLYDMAPPNFCLFRGKLGPDLATVAPYAIGIAKNAPFSDWLLSNDPGNHFGIYVLSRHSLTEIRKHFRDLFIVHNEEGEPMYFRFYDPRVIKTFLKTCEEKELKTFFGPVDTFIAEHEDGTAFSSFTLEDNKLVEKVTKIEN